MVTNNPLNGMSISDCDCDGVSELVVLLVEHLVHREVFVLAVKKSVAPMETEVFTHTKEQ